MAALIVFISLLSVSLSASTCEQGVDYPYGDEPGMPLTLPEADPSLCASKCDSDPDCLVFSYVAPNCYSQGEPPWCYLKSNITTKSSNPCTCAGMSTVCKQGVDRPYGDLPNMPITLSEADPAVCDSLCEENIQCVGYAYIAPNCGSNSGNDAWCYLKGTLENPTSNSCICFGLKGGAAPTPPPPPPPGPVLYKMHNTASLWSLSFDARSLVRIDTPLYSFNVSGDAWGLQLDGAYVYSNALSDPKATQVSDTLLTFAYTYTSSSKTYTIEVDYEINTDWSFFFSKRLKITTSTPSSLLNVGLVEVFQGFHLEDISTTKRQYSSNFIPPSSLGSLGALLRFAPSGQSADVGAFFLVQNPFLSVNVNTSGLYVTVDYTANFPWNFSNPGGAFLSDRGLVGLYTLSGQTYTFNGPQPLPPKQQSKQSANTQQKNQGNEKKVRGVVTGTVDFAERDAIASCAALFYVNPPTKSTKMHIPWCENDYQIDISNSSQADEYTRILQRLKDIGVTHTLFTPQNSAVSSRSNCTDSWCWEEVLWLTLGEDIRANTWMPGDPIPSTIQNLINQANQIGVKLAPYIYPILGFVQDPSWLDNGNANLANIDFQNWLIRTIVDFNTVTGARGAGFDYTYFQDPTSSVYAQWWGWRRILSELRGKHSDVIEVIDNRQANNQWSIWMWVAGTYAEPLMTDEQPESWSNYPVWDPHTDRLAGNHLRQMNYEYAMGRFCPPVALPGFISHQTDRSDESGHMYLTDYLTRDFDYLGHRYSFISSIAAAGVNSVVNMIPARDLSEYNAFGASDQEWIRSWLNFTDVNLKYLLNLKFLPWPVAMGSVDGTYAILENAGYLFLFNPNSRSWAAPPITLSSIGFTSPCNPTLIKEIYPQVRYVALSTNDCNYTFNYGNMDGRSAVVLQLLPYDFSQTVLIGVQGTATLSGSTLSLTNVVGEGGTSPQISILLPSATTVSSVTLNGQSVSFKQTQTTVTLQGITFSGPYFPQSNPITTYDPNFSGGTVTSTFTIPTVVMNQLTARNQNYPVAWDSSDYSVPWLAPGRLLVFVDSGKAIDQNVVLQLSVDGKSIPLIKIWNARGTHADYTFVGHFADFSNLTLNTAHTLSLTVPSLTKGAFQGVFFENVEPILTSQLA